MPPLDDPSLVDPSNAEQAAAWDGKDGAFWAANAERFEALLAKYHPRLLEVAAISPADHVLDVGCGNGATTRDAARRASGGSALGVGLSSQMIERARRLAAAQELANVRFQVADAQVLPLGEGTFDIAVSRFGCMFFGDPVAAFANIARALRPDGRLCLLVWQGRPHQEWMLEIQISLAAGRPIPEPPPHVPGPLSLADPDQVRSILGAAGFCDVELDDVRASLSFGVAVEEAVPFMRGPAEWMLKDLDESQRHEALAALHATAAAHAGPEGVTYRSAAWLVTARKP